uniref:Secreted protein n=1 Tax=Anopheles darlingi TaxID=43151 RepID=A0A2M4DRC3_ANODA
MHHGSIAGCFTACVVTNTATAYTTTTTTTAVVAAAISGRSTISTAPTTPTVTTSAGSSRIGYSVNIGVVSLRVDKIVSSILRFCIEQLDCNTTINFVNVYLITIFILQCSLSFSLVG